MGVMHLQNWVERNNILSSNRHLLYSNGAPTAHSSPGMQHTILSSPPGHMPEVRGHISPQLPCILTPDGIATDHDVRGFQAHDDAAHGQQFR